MKHGMNSKLVKIRKSWVKVMLKMRKSWKRLCESMARNVGKEFDWERDWNV